MTVNDRRGPASRPRAVLQALRYPSWEARSSRSSFSAGQRPRPASCRVPRPDHEEGPCPALTARKLPDAPKEWLNPNECRVEARDNPTQAVPKLIRCQKATGLTWGDAEMGLGDITTRAFQAQNEPLATEDLQ